MAQLELHVTHACNLTCESCSHYSDQGHKGMLDLATADRWLGWWSARLHPAYFNLMGGEPTLHPDLCSFVRLARRHWPASSLKLITNGFFLHRHPVLPEALSETGTLLAVSRHHGSPEYLEKFQPVESLVRDWERTRGVRLEIWGATGRWTRRYRGYGPAMLPYEDGQPRQSWTICPAKYCVQLHLGKLWKCPALAYLGMQNDRHQLGREWAPYLAYTPLAPECSDESLRAFLAHEEEFYCGMCPAVSQPFQLPSPLIPLGRRRRGQ